MKCDCRKPKPGLIQRAASELKLDLTRSWMIGDILDDVEAGRLAGCRTIHIDSGNETEWLLGHDRMPDKTVTDLGAAVDAILTAGGDSSSLVDSGWASARNLLCIRLDTLGDVLMTSPAIRALKESLPDRRITLLTSSVGAEVTALIPEIDQVLVYDAPWMKGEPNVADDHALIEALQSRCFDAAVLFSVYSQNIWASALLSYLAGIPLRLGYSRENPYNLLTDWVPEDEPQRFVRHEVQRQLDLVERVDARTEDPSLSLSVSDRAYVAARTSLLSAGVNVCRPWALIHPGARADSRRYPAAYYAEAARMLAVEDGWQICFSGSVDEMPIIDEIRGRMDAPSYSLAGPIELEELSALIGLAPLLITNNTGPAHIAAALGTPEVVLYALTNPQHMPWRAYARVLRHSVPCQYCYRSVCPEGHHNCLRLIEAAEVARAARSMFGPTEQFLRPTLSRP
jgi:lipopolysaccharide heptosyltransferase II